MYFYLIRCDGNNCKHYIEYHINNSGITAQSVVRGNGWKIAKDEKVYCPDCQREHQLAKEWLKKEITIYE